jgi:glyceraldehyde-3-phosphate dehydrogenase (NADP+)
MSSKKFFLWVGGHPQKGPRTEKITCPFDGRFVGEAPVAGVAELEKALEGAFRARSSLAAMPLYQRSEKLERVASSLEKRFGEFARLIALEAAKPLKLAEVEVRRAIFGFRTAAQECLRLQGEWIRLDWAPAGERLEGILKPFPRGVVLAVSPFNFPLNLAVHKIAPALAAGCPVVAKPASRTPLSLLMLGEVLAEADWPEGSFSILNMPGSLAERAASDDRVAVVSFTGSDTVGWRLKEKLPRKHVTLELGGNAAAYISATAQVEEALQHCLTSAFNYSGQICIHLQRLYVHHEHYEHVLEAFIHYAKALLPEAPDHETCRFSSMISSEEAARVEAWVNEALVGGAKAHTEIRREKGVMLPVVLSETFRGMKVRDQEVFGPVVCVERVKTFEEALFQLNDSRYGLQASIFTDSQKEINAFFETVEAGNLLVNRAPGFRVDHMPYGGIKDSGWGWEGIRYALRHYCEERFCIKPF